jgi:hypothetical protein
VIAAIPVGVLVALVGRGSLAVGRTLGKRVATRQSDRDQGGSNPTNTGKSANDC